MIVIKFDVPFKQQAFGQFSPKKCFWLFICSLDTENSEYLTLLINASKGRTATDFDLLTHHPEACTLIHIVELIKNII